MNPLLNSAYDLHIHTAPDVVTRKCTDTEMANRAITAGMAGFAIKNHYFETASRAALLKLQFPRLDIIGGIVLNRSVGGINPEAVKQCALLSGRMVWMPTMDARAYQEYRHPELSSHQLSSFLTIFNENGQLLPEVYDVIDLIKNQDMILCTGHLSALEGLALIRAAAHRGVQRMIVTHADNPADCYTLDEQRLCVRYGAFIEHSYFTIHRNKVFPAMISSQIAAVGYEKVILTTDFGQIDSPFPDIGLSAFLDALQAEGLCDIALESMVKSNVLNLLR